MGKKYINELMELQETYCWAKSIDVTTLAGVIRLNHHYPLISVGSGGSYSAAELHSTLHRLTFGTTASACTPMELSSMLPSDRNASVWFMSASGNNIDVRRGFKHTALLEPRSVNALVGANGSKLASIASKHQYTNLFEYPLPSGKDGFLATNSLFGFSIILVRAYGLASGGDDLLPNTLDELTSQHIPDLSDIEGLRDLTLNLIKLNVFHVIYSPRLKSAAIDIESKFIEAGLGSIHLADLRNFAHGRHHWFDKQANCGILCISTVEDADLSSKTLSLLPKDVVSEHIVISSSNGSELLIGLLLSFYLAHWRGLESSIDPGRPGVPEYGSKIYRLTANSGFVKTVAREKAAIQRKIVSGPLNNPEYKTWRSAYRRFTKTLSNNKIGGIVLDYDGTLVDGRHKGFPPSESLCAELIRLMDVGVKIGFATGRGKSIRYDLRNERAIPEKYWEEILIGYYNGSDLSTLSDDTAPNGSDGCTNELEDIANLLETNLHLKCIKPKITKRDKQITIEPTVAVSDSFLWNCIQDQLSYSKNSGKIFRSSHSVDIIAGDVSKVTVVKAMEKLIAPNSVILAIGDRGRWPGNDAEMLDFQFSLSVDEVSAAQDRCWNICPAGVRGPQGTMFYLNRIQLKGDSVFFT